MSLETRVQWSMRSTGGAWMLTAMALLSGVLMTDGSMRADPAGPRNRSPWAVPGRSPRSVGPDRSALGRELASDGAAGEVPIMDIKVVTARVLSDGLKQARFHLGAPGE